MIGELQTFQLILLGNIPKSIRTHHVFINGPWRNIRKKKHVKNFVLDKILIRFITTVRKYARLFNPQKTR